MPASKCIRSAELSFSRTAHSAGLKKVLLSAGEVDSAATQVAYGKLLPGETISEHFHPTMEEFFYFLKGQGIYIINDSEFPVEAHTFIYIPAQATHTLVSNGTESLEFVYFGVAID